MSSYFLKLLPRIVACRAALYFANNLNIFSRIYIPDRYLEPSSDRVLKCGSVFINRKSITEGVCIVISTVFYHYAPVVSRFPKIIYIYITRSVSVYFGVGFGRPTVYGLLRTFRLCTWITSPKWIPIDSIALSAWGLLKKSVSLISAS